MKAFLALLLAVLAATARSSSSSLPPVSSSSAASPSSSAASPSSGSGTSACEYSAYNSTLDVSYFYDLAKMTMTNPYYYVFKDGVTGTMYTANICGPVCGTGCSDGQAVCQQSSNLQYYGCGSVNAMSIYGGETGNEVVVRYEDGTPCANGAYRASTIYITCDPTDDPGYIYSVTETNCEYTMCGSTQVQDGMLKLFLHTQMDAQLLGLWQSRSQAELQL
eukprot:TRINITY_DN4304_c0_g1_i2.p1 TRINITY_DN4304_c0_g1~~TRINITY_DN4304_c0_g1_i2.p1  ORF type:complete len:220 (-),score=32.74 TRINITY_DN4304_c0_g1_i2:328-987(-)